MQVELPPESDKEDLAEQPSSFEESHLTKNADLLRRS